MYAGISEPLSCLVHIFGLTCFFFFFSLYINIQKNKNQHNKLEDLIQNKF